MGDKQIPNIGDYRSVLQEHPRRVSDQRFWRVSQQCHTSVPPQIAFGSNHCNVEHVFPAAATDLPKFSMATCAKGDEKNRINPLAHWSFPNMAISRPLGQPYLFYQRILGGLHHGEFLFFEEFLQSLVNPDGGKSRLAESLGRSC